MRSLALLFGTLAAPTAWGQDCPPPGRQLSLAEQQIVAFNMVGVDEYLALALDGFGCSEAATPKQTALFHQLRAHRLFWDSEPDEIGGKAALASARAADPTFWAEKLGDEYKAHWEVSAAEGEGTIGIPGLPDDWVLVVDGKVRPHEGRIDAGPHIVQAGPSEDEMKWAALLDIRDGRQVAAAVPSGTFPVQKPVDAEYRAIDDGGTRSGAVAAGSATSRGKKGRGGVLAAGVVTSVVGGGAVLGTYMAARGTSRDDSSATGLVVGNTAGWGLVGAGVGLTAIGVLPKGTRTRASRPAIHLSWRW